MTVENHVRHATSQDIEAFIDMAEIVHKNCAYSMLNFDRIMCRNVIRGFLTNPQYLLICFEEKNIIKGFFIAEIEIYPFSGETISADIMLYVKPEYLDEDIAIKLIQAYEEWSTKNGAKCIKISHTCGTNRGKINKTFKHLQFCPCPRNYKKGVI